MPLLIMLGTLLLLVLAYRLHGRHLARLLGENDTRATPAVMRSDGSDFVPTPTPVVFAHHFSSIAGAGPIVGPVIAIVYGWVPARLGVLGAGLLIGSVHDYLAIHMSLRERGVSIATIARRFMGRRVFLVLTFLLVMMSVLVCATFLNLSAQALTSRLPVEHLDLSADQTLFRVVATPQGPQVVIGGIASTSVIVITIMAPLLGWMYIKKGVPVWICSLLALGICAASIVIGIYHPVAFADHVQVGGFACSGGDLWRYLLSIYVLVAAGVPVWVFLQSRDFINVHILYLGLGLMLLILLAGGWHGGSSVADGLQAVNIDGGTTALGWLWPTLMITIACGAVSGFHGMFAAGTTVKQLNKESAGRTVCYGGMLLEVFLAVVVICILLAGSSRENYFAYVHPKALLHLERASNPVLGFAMAVGVAAKNAFGLPIAAGALAGMIMLEGFIITTLDTVVRLTRYLLEEAWRTMFAGYVDAPALLPARGAAVSMPAATGGLTLSLDAESAPDEVSAPRGAMSAAIRAFAGLVRHYWFNSGLAVALMLVFALTGGVKALWGIFATANQLLAALILLLAALWLRRQRKPLRFALVPGLLMLVTTFASLLMLLREYLHHPAESMPLLIADLVIMVLTCYCLWVGVIVARRWSARAR